ncbi:MAG: alpha/beta hydrolase [Deltaproteobacteria bacterium]|nr:alpha/beta hydrolase [Deltaproteobacteria bacterium]
MIKILLGAFLIYCCYALLLFLMQRMMIFPRMLIGSAPNGSSNIAGLEKIWLKTTYGKVESWYLPPATAKKASGAPVVIFAHGNGELIDFWPQELKRFNELGLGLLLVEYPGYGRSQGKPTQSSITEAFISAYDKISARSNIDSSRITLFGRSIGGGAVCALAAERPCAALVLMSTFTSIRSFAPRYLLPGFLVLDPFDNLTVVKNYPGPILVLHGKRDEIIPYTHGVKLFRAARNARMITYNSGHNDCPSDWEKFWKDMEGFLREIGILTP